jgi:hypothetical protein
MNTLKIRFWFFCQRWKNKAARWRRERCRKSARPRFEQLRLPSKKMHFRGFYAYSPRVPLLQIAKPHGERNFGNQNSSASLEANTHR